MHHQRRVEAFILVLVATLLVALGFALWRQQHVRELDQTTRVEAT